MGEKYQVGVQKALDDKQTSIFSSTIEKKLKKYQIENDDSAERALEKVQKIVILIQIEVGRVIQELLNRRKNLWKSKRIEESGRDM